jgi:hypothetical protein
LVHASTQQTSFFANYRYHPKLDLLDGSKDGNPAAEDLAKHLMEIQTTSKLQLQVA